MAIADTINSMYENVGEVYDTITNVDLPTNKNIENIPSTIRKSYLDIMNNGIDTIYDNWEKVNGTGTSISLNNTEEAPMTIEYKGNTSQGENPTPTSPQDIHIVSGDNSINVCGKNILDLSGFITHTNYGGLNISYSNGKLLIDGTATSNIDLYLVSTSWNTKGQELSNIINSQISYLTLSSTKSDLIYYFQINGAYIQNTINRANPTDNITNMFVRIPNGTSFNNEEIGIQLERNSQPSTYEEYKGASYEINLGDKELCKIGTYKDRIFKSTGKNLLPNNATTQTINNVTFTINDGKTVSINGAANNGNADFYFVGDASNYVDLGLPSGTYNLNGVSDGALNTYMLYVVQNRNGDLSYYQSVNSAGVNISIQSGDTFRIFIRVLNGVSVSYKTILPQLNKGNQATSYEPYGKDWYLNKQIGKVVLDGTNYNGKGTTGTNAYYLTTNIIALNNNSLAIAYSDMFKPCSFNDRVNGLDIIYSQNGGLNLRTANNTSIDWSSEENCKSWLNSNTPLVYYVLNTPTYEKITGELLNQLEAIKKSYENQTNINQENNDLPFELEVGALEKY